MLDALARLFTATFGSSPETIVPHRADGSNRRLFRITQHDGNRYIGVYGPEPEENRAFVGYSRSMREAGLPVPEIYAVDAAEGIYIEEDLGDTTLFDRLTEARAQNGGRFPEELIPIYRSVVELLARVQVAGATAVDFGLAYPTPLFDRRAMLWDLNYFKYHFLKLAGINFHEARLDRDFETLCDHLAAEPATFFLYRDFQSRNIMLRGDQPWLIDYQGGRLGAPQYDIASLLNDAKADLPTTLRAELLEHHLESLAALVPVDRDRYREAYPHFALIRVLQAMGAYGYRGFFEGKPHFLGSVAYAARTVAAMLEQGLGMEIPELEAALRAIAATDWEARVQKHGVRSGEHATTPMVAAEPLSPTTAAPHPLRVSISSFSYRHGYPAADPAHGGGFVFDCRAIPNPGRLQEYKALTGNDPGVAAYLEQQEALHTFLDRTTGLVADAVANYRERGFELLQVAFGCTGGQHRSVYCAEALGRRLRERYPDISVEVEHRERERWPQAVVATGSTEASETVAAPAST